MPLAFSVRPARWPEDESAISRVRRTVFIEEQGVPEALEWEDWDQDCAWFVAEAAESAVVGIGRLTPVGRIGRMAVLPAWRRRGVGTALLGAVLAEARARGQRRVELSAQSQAVPFYAGLGFAALGDEYLDAGIPHRTMTLELEAGE